MRRAVDAIVDLISFVMDVPFVIWLLLAISIGTLFIPDGAGCP